MATTVIIPARNEGATIGGVVRAFTEGPCRTQVFVGIDKTTDAENRAQTAIAVNEAGAFPIRTTVTGKGQVVWQTLTTASVMSQISNRIVLCDGDYTGLTGDHVFRLIETYHDGMTIGVPDWPDMDVPEHVTMAWPHVAGFRCLPWSLIPPMAYGYLLETQLNIAAAKLRMPIRQVMMPGLKSPFQWPLSEERNAARHADRQWGVENGVFE